VNDERGLAHSGPPERRDANEKDARFGGLRGFGMRLRRRRPLAYRAPTTMVAKADGAADVEGTACNQAVLGLVAWGDGGYAAAVADAKARSGATYLADVRADTTFFNVLFLYDKACTRITAKAVR
jgi:TRL (tRNA-associated locus)-like protein